MAPDTHPISEPSQNVPLEGPPSSGKMTTQQGGDFEMYARMQQVPAPPPPFPSSTLMNVSPLMMGSPQLNFYPGSAADPYGIMLTSPGRYPASNAGANYPFLPSPASPSLFNIPSPWNGTSGAVASNFMAMPNSAILPPILNSPSIGDTNGSGMIGGGNSGSSTKSHSTSTSFSPNAATHPAFSLSSATFPESPPLLDASQMLMSPSRFRKRRHLSPLISGYIDLHPNGMIDGYHQQLVSTSTSAPSIHSSYPSQSQSQSQSQSHLQQPSSSNIPSMPSMIQMTSSTPSGGGMESAINAAMLRRAPTLKVPVSATTPSGLFSPRQKPATLVLPCYMNQENKIIPQGPFGSHTPANSAAANGTVNGTSSSNAAPGYWEETRRNSRAFLREAEAIDEENITIIEIKQLLRRYCINATGKKAVLMDRIRRLQAYFQQMDEMHQPENIIDSTDSAPANAATAKANGHQGNPRDGDRLPSVSHPSLESNLDDHLFRDRANHDKPSLVQSIIMAQNANASATVNM